MHHSHKETEVMRELETSLEGITSKEAESRLEKYGLNELKKTQNFKALKAFVAQFQSSLVFILFFAAAVSFFLESKIDAIVIGLIIVVNAVLGFLQEFKAEKSLEHLRKMLVPVSRVIRDGRVQEVSSRKLVPGDILMITEGDTVSADARLIEARRLQVNEAALTGESVPVSKHTEELDEHTPLAERNNMIYQGTDVVVGSGKAVVVDIGMRTQLGQISTLVQEIIEDKNPFQQKLDTFARKVGAVILLLCGVVVAGLLWGGESWVHSLMVSVSLAVSAIPEGLPAVISLGFALATKRLVKKNVIVRKLPSSETLGRVNTICTDKTGTLTKSHMEVVETYAVDDKAQDLMYQAAGLCHSIEVAHDEDGKEQLLGDPTELAIVQHSVDGGDELLSLAKRFTKHDEIPFSSERKMMTTMHEVEKNYVAYTKGAPEKICDIIEFELVDGKKKKLTTKRKEEIEKTYHDMASQGLRVLAFSYNDLGVYKEDKKIADDVVESAQVFLGFQAMQDPAREEVPGAIDQCQKAGIRVVMLTGDSLLTARAIGHQIGIKGDALNASEIEDLSDQELLEKLKTVSIFSRVEPADKLRVVNLLKSQGQIVAMTGDGVNDALALKRADIGIAMGIRGTDVSKSASDMVLVDDNFASIVGGVKEGRRIFTNIKKFVTYLLAANFYEVVLVFGVIVVFRDPHLLPFLPLQILWINLATDSLPALALSTQKAEADVMKKMPVQEELLDGMKGLIVHCGLTGFVLLAYTLWVYHGDMDVARTMIVTVSVFYQMLLAINCASWQPAWKSWGNSTLWWSIVISLAMHIGLMYSFLGTYFSFTHLGLMDWAVVVILGLIGSLSVEVYKLVSRNKDAVKSKLKAGFKKPIL